MTKLVLVRHGESVWNRDNIFTGWTDVDLSCKGTSEAEEAGQLLADNEYVFDIAFTSMLKRAIGTLWIILEALGQMGIPIHSTWRLNERFYGDLQGRDKAETAKEFGDEQVFRWRRGYDVKPPALERTDERYPGRDPRYSDLKEHELPVTESLKDAFERFLPYWQKTISPEIASGRRVLIVAHHNILMSLVKWLDRLPDKDTERLEFPTAVPLIYELDGGMKPVCHFYLKAGNGI